MFINGNNLKIRVISTPDEFKDILWCFYLHFIMPYYIYMNMKCPNLGLVKKGNKHHAQWIDVYAADMVNKHHLFLSPSKDLLCKPWHNFFLKYRIISNHLFSPLYTCFIMQKHSLVVKLFVALNVLSFYFLCNDLSIASQGLQNLWHDYWIRE